MSWSRHGYENASYCISQTGRKPAMQRPTALPRIPASASGVSTHRSGPKRSRNPAVARKTPPARPTSSPMTSTDSSRSSSTWKASLIASTIESSGTENPPQLLEVGAERGGRVDVGVREEELRVGRRLRLGLRDPAAHELLRLGAHRLRLLGVEDAQPLEVPLVAADALALALLLNPLEIDVGARVVRGRVRRRAVGDRLDERGPLARARPRHRFARRLVHGQNVRAVHPHPGHPVPDGLVCES